MPLIALAALVADCAAPIIAPPLEKRSIEAEPVSPPEAIREPAVPPDPALTARLDELLRTAEADHARFEGEREGAARLVRAAAGAAVGTEPWTAAQQAVSALETVRGPLGRSMEAVERLRQDPAEAGSGARTAVAAAADRLADLDAQERQAVAALAAMLR